MGAKRDALPKAQKAKRIEKRVRTCRILSFEKLEFCVFMREWFQGDQKMKVGLKEMSELKSLEMDWKRNDNSRTYISLTTAASVLLSRDLRI